MIEFFKKIWEVWWLKFTLPLKAVSIGVILLLILIFIFLATMDSCRTRNTQKKIDEIKSNITEQETIANVKANEKANLEMQVKENETNKNIAVNNFSNSLKRDSSTFSTDEIESKFCKRNCHDSTCESWRRRHADFFCE